jgi:flagellin FlaB
MTTPKIIKKYNKLVKRKGLAGLDTAIILIAFIITASVLAFVAINMGLFVTQKAKTTINKGEETASTALQLSSSMLYATNFPANTQSYWIYFTVSPSAGISSVLLSPATTSISFEASSLGIAYGNIYAYTLLNYTTSPYILSQTSGGQSYHYYSSPYAALVAMYYAPGGSQYISISTTKPTSGNYFAFNYSGTEYYAEVQAHTPIAITFPVAGDPLVGSDVAPAGSTIGVIILFPSSPPTPTFQYQTITIQIIPNIGAPLTLSEYVYQPDANVSVIG